MAYQDIIIGESVSVTPNGIFKFNCDMSFTNKIYHSASQQFMSIPPNTDSQNTWTQSDFPLALKKRAFQVMDALYGCEVEGIGDVTYRMCW